MKLLHTLLPALTLIALASSANATIFDLDLGPLTSADQIKISIPEGRTCYATVTLWSKDASGTYNVPHELSGTRALDAGSPVSLSSSNIAGNGNIVDLLCAQSIWAPCKGAEPLQITVSTTNPLSTAQTLILEGGNCETYQGFFRIK